MRTSGSFFGLSVFEPAPFDWPCLWIATGDRRELRRALPVAGTPVLLSRVAWQLSDPKARRLIEPGDVLLPWRLTREGHDEALAVQRAAIARGDRPLRLAARRDEVLRDLCGRCFGPRPAAALLAVLRAHRIAVSGVSASGERVAIDPLLLSQLMVDLKNDTAWTGDGTQQWRALAATRAAEARPDPAAQPLPKRTVQAELARWYRETYPAGHPVGRKLDMLASEAAGVLGRTVSGRTMRRAVVEARRAAQGTSAAN